MINWSEVLIGVEKKPDGQLIYRERGSLFLYNRTKKFFTISNSTYKKLNIFTIIGVNHFLCVSSKIYAPTNLV